MDDILRRMLEVERQALAEGVRLRAELAAEVRHLLADRGAPAAAETRLQARVRTFAGEVRSRAGRVLRELAWPVGAEG